MHATSLPHLTNPSRAFELGGLDGDYIEDRRAAAYLSARSAQRYLDAERLHLVADAPRFFYPAWVVWREDPNPELLSVVLSTLNNVVQAAENMNDPLVDETSIG